MDTGHEASTCYLVRLMICLKELDGGHIDYCISNTRTERQAWPGNYLAENEIRGR